MKLSNIKELWNYYKVTPKEFFTTKLPHALAERSTPYLILGIMSLVTGVAIMIISIYTRFTGVLLIALALLLLFLGSLKRKIAIAIEHQIETFAVIGHIITGKKEPDLDYTKLVKLDEKGDVADFAVRLIYLKKHLKPEVGEIINLYYPAKNGEISLGGPNDTKLIYRVLGYEVIGKISQEQVEKIMLLGRKNQELQKLNRGL